MPLRASLLALILLPAASSREQRPAPEPRLVTCWPVARDVRLALRAHERGTSAPLELRFEVKPRDGYGACHAPGPRPTRVVARADVPAPLLVEWAHAAEWRTSVTPLWDAGDSTRWSPDATFGAALPGAGGELALAPLPERAGVPDSAHVTVRVADRHVQLTLSAAQAWSLVWTIGELGLLFDPAGRPDFGAVFLGAQVDEPVRVLPNHLCEQKYQEWEQRLGREGSVLLTFVVGASGSVEAESIEVVEPRGNGDFASAGRDILRCMTYRPAMLRGRAVRAKVQQPFIFSFRSGPSRTGGSGAR